MSATYQFGKKEDPQLSNFGTWQGNKWLGKETFAAGEQKVYKFRADWNVDRKKRARDWSVVAWGLSDKVVTVTYGDQE